MSIQWFLSVCLFSIFIQRSLNSKQSKKSINSWIYKQIWPIHTKECYWVNTIISYLKTAWGNLKIIMLNERRHKEYIFMIISLNFTNAILSLQPIVRENGSELPVVGRRGLRKGLPRNMRKLSGVVDMFTIMIVIMVSRMYNIYIPTYQICILKLWVYYTLSIS